MSRQKLVETVLVKNEVIKPLKTLQENVDKILSESGITQKYVAAYTFPISRPDKKNLNERVYTRKLWEKVINEGQAERSFGLTDHPEDEGSVKDTACVWKNARFSEDGSLVLADCYLFGQWGRHIQEALDAGGNMGLSTVGYGDFKEDGFTIEESSYELERMADFVLNPSYEVFGSIEDQHTENKLSDDTNTINESTSDESDKPKEKVETMSDTKKATSKIEEKNFKMSIRNLVEKADAIESPLNRKNEYVEILEYFDDVDFAPELKDEVQAKLSDTENKLQELAEKGSKTDELEESTKVLHERVTSLEEEKQELEEKIARLSEEYDRAISLLDSLKSFSRKVKELYETQRAKSNGMVSASEYNELLTYVEGIEKELEEFKMKYASLREKIAKNKKKRENRDDEEKSRRRKVREEYRSLRQAVHEEEDDDDDDDDDDDEDDDDDDEKDESVYTGVNPDVLLYYQDLEEANPAMVKIKKYILSSRTVLEAQREFMRLKSLVEGDFTVERRDIDLEDEGRFERKSHDVHVEHPFHEGWV